MRRLKGTIVSAKMKKTVVVRVGRMIAHPHYGKHYRVSRTFKAHDENGEYRPGDIVIMEETRPTSREKRWRVVELVRRQQTAVEEITE